jgi:hypothetical protein
MRRVGKSARALRNSRTIRAQLSARTDPNTPRRERARSNRQRTLFVRGVLLPLLLTGAVAWLFDLTFSQSHEPLGPPVVVFWSPGLNKAEASRLGLIVRVQTPPMAPLLLGGSCAREADVIVSVSTAALPDDARRHLNAAPFTVGIESPSRVRKVLIAPAHPRRFTDVDALPVSGTTGQYQISGARFGAYSWKDGLVFEAPWVSKRGFGSCWRQMPELRGVGAVALLDNVSSHARDRALPRRATSVLLSDERLVQSESFPPPTGTGGPNFYLWSCNAPAAERSCQAVAVTEADWASRFRQLALLVIGGLVALIVQILYASIPDLSRATRRWFGL